MQVRLAFAIAIQVPFDILLLDEVLAVGDQRFQEKCFAYFERHATRGRPSSSSATTSTRSGASARGRSTSTTAVCRRSARPTNVISLYLDRVAAMDAPPAD